MCSQIWQSMRSYCGKKKGAFLQGLALQALSLLNLQSGSSSSKMPRLELNRHRYGKWEMYVESASSLEQVIAELSDSKLGSKPLALSWALIGPTRQTADLVSTASRDPVKYCLVCLDRTHLTPKCPLIANANESIRKSNADLRENCLAREETSKIWGPKMKVESEQESQLVDAAVKSELLPMLYPYEWTA